MQDNRDFTLFYTIFYYCCLIILAPIFVFFGTKIFILDGLFGLSNVSSNVWSAIVAVVVLHILLGMYIYRAYSESGKAKPDKID